MSTEAPSLSTEAARRLVVAVIENAINTYKSGVDRKEIKNGKVALRVRHKSAYSTHSKWRDAISRRTELCEVVEYFKKGGGVETCIDLGLLKIDADSIRRGLIKYEAQP
tara:strand:+ start:150 stop:476 length:327 start_codon:yes stop_codon:yes gene_type:complete